MVQAIGCRQVFGQNLTFKVLVWPWKWGQCHHNLNISLSCLSGVSVQVWSNTSVGSGDRVQTRFIFTVFIVRWSWKLGEDHQNLMIFFNYSNDTIHKVCQNPSFGSRDRVQTSFIWSKFDIQSTSVTLKMQSMSSKSNHFFPLSQWCFYANLVKIH